jgi:hypothetical protein
LKYNDNLKHINNLNNDNPDTVNQSIKNIVLYLIYLYNNNYIYIDIKYGKDIFIILLKYLIYTNDNLKNTKIQDLKTKILKIYKITKEEKLNINNCSSIDKYTIDTNNKDIKNNNDKDNNDNKDNKEVNDIDKFNKIKNTCTEIKNIFDYENIFCKDLQKIYICDIFKNILKNSEILNKITNSDVRPYDNDEKFKILLKQTFNNVYENIKKLYELDIEEDTKQILIDQFVENDGKISLKIISPQIFDANSTTGSKITSKDLDVYSKLDNNGFYCNINHFDQNDISILNNYKSIISEINLNRNNLIPLVTLIDENEISKTNLKIYKIIEDIKILFNELKTSLLDKEYKLYIQNKEINEKDEKDEINIYNIPPKEVDKMIKEKIKSIYNIYEHINNITKLLDFIFEYIYKINDKNNILKELIELKKLIKDNEINKKIDHFISILEEPENIEVQPIYNFDEYTSSKNYNNIKNILEFINSIDNKFNLNSINNIVNNLNNYNINNINKRVINNITNVINYVNVFLSSYNYINKDSCCLNILDNKVCIYQNNEYKYKHNFRGQIVNYDFDVLNIDINNINDEVNEYYKINKVCVLNLKDKENILEYKVYKDNRKQFNEDIILILQYYISETISNENNIELSGSFKKLTKKQQEIIIDSSLVYIGQFVYSSKYKILYCLNTGPGVSDLVYIYSQLVNTNDSNEIKNYFLENILTIKRIGDYSQIDYCKKNNYIYVSNDIMSSSFSYIIGSKFIGSLSNFGIFIKNNNEYTSCVSSSSNFISCNNR